MKLICNNKKAKFNYELIDFYEAGIELKGTEVKSIYLGNVNIDDSYITFHQNEIYVINMHVSNYDYGNRFNLDPTRKRKLLLHKKEIIKLKYKKEKERLTIIPIKIYFKNSKIKLQIALSKGLKKHDKREKIKARDEKRYLEKM